MFKKSFKNFFRQNVLNASKWSKIDPESLPGPPDVVSDRFRPCRVDLKHFLKIEFLTVRRRFLLTDTEGTLKNLLFKGESSGPDQA